MQLDHAAIAVPGAAVCRYDRLGADLEVRSRPDDPWLNRAGRLIGWRPADRGREGYFHQRDQLTEGRTKPDVLHAAFDVRKAVFESEAVAEIVRVRHAGGRCL